MLWQKQHDDRISIEERFPTMAADDITSQASFHNELNRLDAIKFRDPQTTIQLAEKLYADALQLHDWAAASQCQCEISKAYTRLGLYPDAIAPAQKALALAQEHQNPIAEGYAWSALGAIHAYAGNYTEALELFSKQRQIGIEHDEPKLTELALSSTAFIYCELEEFAKCIDLYEEDLAWLEKLSLPERKALSVLNIGVTYHRMKLFREALAYYEQALQLAEERNIFDVKLYALASTGNCLCELNELDKAQEHLRKLEAFCHQHGNSQHPAVLLGIARLHLARHQLPQAIAAYEQGLQAAKQVNYRQAITIALEEIIRAYRELGDFKTALQYFEEYHQTRTLLVHEQSRLRHDILSSIYQNQQLHHEAEIQRLRSENAERKLAEMQQSEGIRMGRIRLKERAHISRELHDSVSQSLFMINATVQSISMDAALLSPESQAQLTDLHKLSKTAIAEMRTLLNELRPSFVQDQSIGKLLSQLVDSIRMRITANITLTVSDSAIPDDIKLVFYRVTQEALSNVAKYAGASNLMISCLDELDRHRLIIEDNGRGFDMAASSFGKGLHSIRERAKANKLSLEIQSSLGHGTRIEAVWIHPEKKA